MIITKYNVKLHRLKEEHLELVRIHRNSARIRERMFYQKEISPEEQKKWFLKINNDKHFYFVIQAQEKFVGLLHGVQKSIEHRIMDAGIFIWDESFIGTRTAAAATLCGLDFYFMLLNMNKVYTQVRTDNHNVIAFNEHLGFQKVEEIVERGMLRLYLTKEAYFENTFIIRKALMRAAKETSQLSWGDISLSENDKVLLKAFINL